MNENSARNIYSLLRQVFDDRKPRVSVERLLVGCSQVWARIYLRSIRFSGERLVMCLAEDLTYEKRQLLLMDAIKRAKTEWEQTVDTVPESIALVDSDHRIIRMNRAMADRAGCTVQSAIKEPCYKIVHGRDTQPNFVPSPECSKTERNAMWTILMTIWGHSSRSTYLRLEEIMVS